MLKHIRDIRIAANRSYSWYKYDEQFRLRRVSDPTMSSGEINIFTASSGCYQWIKQSVYIRVIGWRYFSTKLQVQITGFPL